MSRRVIILAALVALLLLAITPVAYAQTRQIDTDQILKALGPRNGMPYILFDILLYGIFFIGFIAMMLVPDKQLSPSILMIGVLGCAIVAKVNVFRPTDLPMLGINATMFVIPLIVAGMLRGRGKTPKALGPAIFTGILGGIYFFAFWFFEQSNIG
jgi:FtsH-binding integral membrane protein